MEDQVKGFEDMDPTIVRAAMQENPAEFARYQELTERESNEDDLSNEEIDESVELYYRLFHSSR